MILAGKRRAAEEAGAADANSDESLRRAALSPHLALVRAPKSPHVHAPPGDRIAVATYNVHRWTGLNGRVRPDPARAGFVISELGVEVIALQEVLRPERGEDPLEAIADALGLHVVFACTRAHRLGLIGNAILSRWPIAAVSLIELECTRMEKRVAVSAQIELPKKGLSVVATHLALSDRTRHKQVEQLLDHQRDHPGATVLLGDMNAWRQCRATRALDRALRSHHNQDWPPSFPSARPVLALDRVYAHGARVISVAAYTSEAARRASDHLPVVAEIELA
jgi:endonuclease/exonuclease/phosphatase family metal-dependent hydrolase